MFRQDMDAWRIAKILRVSTKEDLAGEHEIGVPVAAGPGAGGDAALASKGPGGSGCKLDERQLARLAAALDAGPAAHGRDTDQRWTLARVTALIARLCGCPTRCAARRICCTGWGSPRRSRCTGPLSAMT